MNRIINDSDLEFGRVDFNTWRQRDNALRTKYSPSYMDYRYDENGIVSDYSGLSQLLGGSDFEEAAYKLVKDIEDKYVTETHNLWDATNAATKKILRDGYKAGMMSKDTYQYVRDMYSHYIPLRGCLHREYGREWNPAEQQELGETTPDALGSESSNFPADPEQGLVCEEYGCQRQRGVDSCYTSD